MTEIEILMMDGCTKAEAEKHLKRGTTVFDEDDFRLFVDEIISDSDEEEQEKYKEMLEKKKPLADWGIVEHEDKTWFIMYVL